MKIKISETVFDAWIVRAVDGDTLICLLPVAWGIWVEKSVRIAGIDSWELQGDHAQDARNTAAAIDAQYAMQPCTLDLVRSGTDAHGRLVANVTAGGRCLASELCRRGLAWPTNRPEYDRFRPII